MKVERGESCWLWTAGVNDHGYGVFKFAGRGTTAHRVAYILTHGDVPVGLQVCHTCDTPPCVNPDHLFLGTPLENSADMIRKGRRHGSRFTPIQIQSMVFRRTRGESLYALGRDFGVSHVAIYKLTRALMPVRSG